MSSNKEGGEFGFSVGPRMAYESPDLRLKRLQTGDYTQITDEVLNASIGFPGNYHGVAPKTIVVPPDITVYFSPTRIWTEPDFVRSLNNTQHSIFQRFEAGERVDGRSFIIPGMKSGDTNFKNAIRGLKAKLDPSPIMLAHSPEHGYTLEARRPTVSDIVNLASEPPRLLGEDGI